MNKEIMTMPQLGESVTEGTIIKWFVQPGDAINEYDTIAEIQTDKVTAELPSSFTGKIAELTAKEGETLPVGATICSFVIEGGNEAVVEAVVEPQPKAIERDDSKKARFSPAVLKLADEHHINLSEIAGTGVGGRITRKDVMQYIQSPSIKEEKKIISAAENKPVETMKLPDKKETAAFVKQQNDKEIPVVGVRKAIAANMVRSKTEIPHAWMMIEADVTNLVAYRNEIKDRFKEDEGFPLTYFSFFMKAVAVALKEYPQLNAFFAGDKIIQKKDINLNIAVATDEALFVPVIKNVDERSIKGIAKEVYDLSQKVRTNSLKMSELEGGTFTVNNTGSFGSVQSMGIINYPQVAILQIESIVKRPVFLENGMFGARDMVNLCLSLDHRAVDGYICGKFMNRVKYLLENMNKETLSIY